MPTTDQPARELTVHPIDDRDPLDRLLEDATAIVNSLADIRDFLIVGAARLSPRAGVLSHEERDAIAWARVKLEHARVTGETHVDVPDFHLARLLDAAGRRHVADR